MLALAFLILMLQQHCAKGVYIYIYILDELLGITDEWLLAHVTRNMFGPGFNHGVCLVLALAMLWCIFDSSRDGLVPDCIRSLVVGAYSDLGQWNALENGTNPVKKVPRAVDGHDSEVIIDEIIGGGGVEMVMEMSVYDWVCIVRRYVCFPSKFCIYVVS